MKLDTLVVQRLRDHLIQRSHELIGSENSGRYVRENSQEEDAVMQRFRPFAELLFLVARADGQVGSRERAVVQGAFRVLTSGRVRGELLEDLEKELGRIVGDDGLEARLESVCGALSGDREDAELALHLAGAVALADSLVDPDELALLRTIRAWLGISVERAESLLNEGRHSVPPRAGA